MNLLSKQRSLGLVSASRGNDGAEGHDEACPSCAAEQCTSFRVEDPGHTGPLTV